MGISFDPLLNWPESNEYSGPCMSCGFHFTGSKARIIGRKCRACSEAEAKIKAKVVDANVEAVREKLRIRAEHGLTKYGVTTERTDLTRKQWLIHAQEEALDLAVYLQRLISEEPEESECPKCGHSQFHTE